MSSDRQMRMKCLYEEETDMRYTLENENLKVEIDSFGAEIKSVKRKSDNFEYMWCGDKKYWGRTSPVLFPFVGAPKNKEYRYDGKLIRWDSTDLQEIWSLH